MRARPLVASLASGAALVTVLAVPSVAQTTGVHRWLGSVGLLPASASFTDLSLDGSDKLYKTVDWYGHVTFSFLATNTGSTTKNYAWSVASGPQAAQRTVAHGTFSLAGRASTRIPVTFTIADCAQRNLVNVSLHGPDERQPSLHFWVLDRRSAAWKAAGGPGCEG